MSRIPIAGGMSEFYLGNSTLIQVWDNFGYTLNGFMTSFNLLGHTAIAFNRFPVFVSEISMGKNFCNVTHWLFFRCGVDDG
jgi:hypothetical protein